MEQVVATKVEASNEGERSLGTLNLRDRDCATTLPEERISELTDVIKGLLDDLPRRNAWRENLRALQRPDAASALAGMVREVAA